MVIYPKTRFSFLCILGAVCIILACLHAIPCAAQDEEPQSNYVITSDPYGL